MSTAGYVACSVFFFFFNQCRTYANGKATLEVYSQGNPQASDYECGIWVPVQTEGKQML